MGEKNPNLGKQPTKVNPKNTLKKNLDLMSNYKLFPTMYISHIAQYLELKNIIQTSAFKHITIYLEKKRIAFSDCYPTLPHCHPLTSLACAKNIRHIYVWEEREENTEARPSSCLLFDSITGVHWTLWWLHGNDCHKKIFAEFQLAPSEAARWNDAARGRDGF